MYSSTALHVLESLMVLCGALFMIAAILSGRKMRRDIPGQLLGRWKHMSLLMQFFLVGYLLFFTILVSSFTVPSELITAPVFLAGAIFVFIVIRLTRETIRRIRQTENDLRSLNESLEERVAARTRELDRLNESLERRVFERTLALQQSREFLQTVLDSMSDEVLIIETGTMNIVRANAAFLARHGVSEAAIIGRTCYEVAHQKRQACPSDDLPCPLRETVNTGGFAVAEQVYRDAGGNKRYSEVSSSPIRDIDGRIVRVVHVLRDITERRSVEEAVRESEERYRRLVELSPDGISLHVDGKFVFVNPAGARLLGARHPDQLIGMSAADIVHPLSREIEKSRLEQLGINADLVPWTEERYLRLDGTEVDVEVVGVHFLYQGQTAVQTIFRDITERKLVAQRIERLALYDTITGLPNRTLFFDRLNQVLALARRNQSQFALLFMDLDDFKEINDTLGHEAGDRLLQEVSQRIVSSVRKLDTIARMGGDEFVGISGMLTAPADAGTVAQKLLAAMSEPFAFQGHPRSVGISIGISLFPRDGEDAATLLSKADIAMYQVKRSGKGNYRHFADSSQEALTP